MKQHVGRQRSIVREVSRFGFRKASVGLASCLLGTLLFLGGPVTVAADTGLQLGQVVSQSEMRLEYQHAFLSELTQTERQVMVKGLPENIQNGERIIFVYADEAPATAATSLPRTGSELPNWTLGLAGFVLLVTAVASKRKRPLFLVGLTLSGLGATALGPVAEAYAPGHLGGHNRVVTVAVGQTLPEPVLVNGKKPIGHIRLTDKLALVEEGKTAEQAKPANPTPVSTMEPDKPVDPTPVSPTEPDKSVDPTPVSPTEPDKPVDPTPVSPTEPDKPVDPTPVSPTEPDKPVDPTPVSPTEPDKPVDPTPVSPTEPDKPVDPTPVSPTEPDKPVDPAPVSPTDPDKPVIPLPVRTEEVVQKDQVLAFDTKYVEDASLAKGEQKLVQAGQAGSLIIHYKVIKEDGQEISRSEVGRDRVEPVQEIIAIGTAADALPTDYPVVEDKPELALTEKRETSQQALPFDTQYVDNPNRSAGTADIEVQAGSEGAIRWTYVVTLADGQEVARSLEAEERIEPTPRIVERGTGQVGSHVETRTEAVAFETIVKEDSSLASGTERVEREGEEGVDTVTVTTPTLNGQVNGEPVETRVRTKEPVSRIVVRGTKVDEPKTTTHLVEEVRSIAYETEEITDPTLDKGQTRTEEGQAGEETITYELTLKDGQEVSRREVSRQVTKAPVSKKIYVGTKVEETRETSRETVVLKKFETEYIDDATMWADDAPIVEQEGQDQTETRETVVTKVNGQVTEEEVTVVASTDLRNQRIRRGTKTFDLRKREEVTELPYKQVEEIDPNIYVDLDPVVKIAGKKGQSTVEVTEKLDRNGQVIETSRSEPVLVAAVDEVLVRGSKVRTKPTVVISQLVKDETARTAVASCQLEDPTESFVSAKALLYKGDTLVNEVPLTLVNGQLQPLTLTDLDYYESYVLKTEVTYDTKSGQGNQTEIQTDTEPFELVLKKIEFKDVDSVSLYKVDGKAEKRLLYLDGVDSDLSRYLVKIKSDQHKEVLLPVSAITEATKDGQAVYKVTVATDQLVQEQLGRYVDNYSFYVAKASQDAGVYTSFKALLDAMKTNLSGSFILGADMTADEVSLSDTDKTYLSETFKGTLTGQHDGKRYAIYNLAKPLFNVLEGATISDLDLREVAINSKDAEQAPLAKEAQKTTIEQVAVEGSVTGHSNIAGVVVRANSQTVLKNTSFTGRLTALKRDGGENIVGGLVTILRDNNSKVMNSSADVKIYIAGAAKAHRAGGLVGVISMDGRLQDSYARGNIYGEQANGQLGGLVGSTWTYGHVNDVISMVEVVNGNATHGDSGYGAADLKRVYAVSGEYQGTKDQWTTEISADEAKEKIAAMGVTATVTDSGQLELANQYRADYSKVKQAQAGRHIAYENMEKLLPFYNKELIVYYGNKLASDDKLTKTALLDVVPMVDKRFVTDVHTDKAAINRLLLHYADKTVDYLNLTYKEDFKNAAISEYTVAGKDILYTPEQFISSYDQVISRVSSALAGVTLESPEVRKLIGLEADKEWDKLAYLYLKPTLEAIQADLPTYLRKVLAMDKSIHTLGQVVEDQLVQKLTEDKEAFLLGLSYMNRWYNINYGDLNTRDLMTYKLDFFGNSGVSVLDNLISLGKLGYTDLHAKSSVGTYTKVLRPASGKTDLFTYLEAYRELFLPTTSNNDWLKGNTRAYIVEKESRVAEARAKQEAGYNEKKSKYSLGIYNRLSENSWGQAMVLPLLTLTDESVYVISVMNAISFGGYERYVDKKDADFNLINYVRAKVDETAVWQRDHADFWYKILTPTSKEKLFRIVPNFDGFHYKNGQASWRGLEDSSASIQDFFGPISKWYKNNGSGAYADGSLTHFVVNRILDRYGSAVFTHEMVHNSDGNIYLEGHGRREGQGGELFALGLLQAPFYPDGSDIGLNTLFTDDVHSKTRLHIANPVEDFQTVEDLNHYVHGMFDMVYVLDYLEGTAILKQSDTVKKQWLRKIENYYVKDNKDRDTHAGNAIRPLTDEEVAKLVDFNSLIDQDIINRRGFSHSSKLQRNGYYTADLLSPIYAALDNKKGAPGDLMFRRMAYELMAAKGYHQGFIPYASSQLAKQAFDEGSRIYSHWSKKDVALITDDHVFKHIFGGEYKDWADFKKAMYQERIAKLGKLKPITIQYELGKPNSTKEVTITSYQELEKLMADAVAEDLKRINNETNDIRVAASWVQALKKKVYNAYLRDTDDFKTSIFND